MRSERLNAERTKRKEGMSDGRFCFAAFCTISHGFSLDLLRFCWIKNNASGSGTVGKKWRGKKAFRRTNFTWTVSWQYHTSGWLRPLSASQTPIRIIFTQEQIHNKINSDFYIWKRRTGSVSSEPPCLINHFLIRHILESALFSKLWGICNYRSWFRSPSTSQRSCTVSEGFNPHMVYISRLFVLFSFD